MKRPSLNGLRNMSLAVGMSLFPATACDTDASQQDDLEVADGEVRDGEVTVGVYGNPGASDAPVLDISVPKTDAVLADSVKPSKDVERDLAETLKEIHEIFEVEDIESDDGPVQVLEDIVEDVEPEVEDAVDISDSDQTGDVEETDVVECEEEEEELSEVVEIWELDIPAPAVEMTTEIPNAHLKMSPDGFGGEDSYDPYRTPDDPEYSYWDHRKDAVLQRNGVVYGLGKIVLTEEQKSELKEVQHEVHDFDEAPPVENYLEPGEQSFSDAIRRLSRAKESLGNFWSTPTKMPPLESCPIVDYVDVPKLGKVATVREVNINHQDDGTRKYYYVSIEESMSDMPVRGGFMIANGHGSGTSFKEWMMPSNMMQALLEDNYHVMMIQSASLASADIEIAQGLYTVGKFANVEDKLYDYALPTKYFQRPGAPTANKPVAMYGHSGMGRSSLIAAHAARDIALEPDELDVTGIARGMERIWKVSITDSVDEGVPHGDDLDVRLHCDDWHDKNLAILIKWHAMNSAHNPALGNLVTLKVHPDSPITLGRTGYDQSFNASLNDLVGSSYSSELAKYSFQRLLRHKFNYEELKPETEIVPQREDKTLIGVPGYDVEIDGFTDENGVLTFGFDGTNLQTMVSQGKNISVYTAHSSLFGNMANSGHFTIYSALTREELDHHLANGYAGIGVTIHDSFENFLQPVIDGEGVNAVDNEGWGLPYSEMAGEDLEVYRYTPTQDAIQMMGGMMGENLISKIKLQYVPAHRRLVVDPCEEQ